MKTVQTLAELRQFTAEARRKGQRLAFVPTMGNLHEGHLSLIARGLQEADVVMASIFVNPLQFGPNEDLEAYPRTLAADQQKLSEAGCSLLFAPDVHEMYPHGQQQQTLVSVPGVSEGLCGASRPGHFDGVATVVTKLLNMTQPDVAIFGRKDYQQLAVIRTLVRDLNLPVEILGEPTCRAASGLALSSRNGYLSPEQLAQAPQLYRVLQAMADQLQPETNREQLQQWGIQQLSAAGFEPDYLEVRRAVDLGPAGPEDRQLVILAAARLGSTRLIDNLEVDLGQR